MNPPDGAYCAVYVRGPGQRDEVAQMVARAVGGRRDGWSVTLDGLQIDACRNSDSDPAREQFLFWPFKLDLDIAPNTARSTAVDVTTRLLQTLWHLGHDAIAACDYEDDLPDHGGRDRYF